MKVALTAFLLALAVAGCRDAARPESKAAAAAGSDQHETEAAPTRDIAWLARLHRWEVALDRDSANVRSVARGVMRGSRTAGDLKRALRPLVACPRTLAAQVGEPRPTRYSGSYALLLRACRMTRRFALDVIAEEGGGSLANERSKAEDLFLLAHADLESSLVAHRDLPTVGGETDRSRIEPRLSRAVSTLVYKSQGAGVEVRCWSPREWRIVQKEWGAYIGTTDFLGFAWGETGVSIAPDACEPLVEFVYEGNRPSGGRKLVLASASIGLLAHEAQHLVDNWASEAETECNGMQSLRRTAGFLGASEAYAALLAETYWADVYPLNTGEYRTSACRNDGPLDQRPGSDVWP